MHTCLSRTLVQFAQADLPEAVATTHVLNPVRPRVFLQPPCLASGRRRLASVGEAVIVETSLHRTQAARRRHRRLITDTSLDGQPAALNAALPP